MIVDIELFNGEKHRWTGKGSFKSFMWSLQFHGGLRTADSFISRAAIATIFVVES